MYKTRQEHTRYVEAEEDKGQVGRNLMDFFPQLLGALCTLCFGSFDVVAFSLALLGHSARALRACPRRRCRPRPGILLDRRGFSSRPIDMIGQI